MPIERKTVLSSDRLYRYTLWREWDVTNPLFVQFIGLNPSTADETRDDATIRRCLSFAKRWPVGALCMTNLFAYRSTDPSQLKTRPDPIGKENDANLIRVAKEASFIVAAWGIRGGYQHRNAKIAELIPNLKCLGLTKGGHPKHPLYISSNIGLEPFQSQKLSSQESP